MPARSVSVIHERAATSRNTGGAAALRAAIFFTHHVFMCIEFIDAS